MNFDKAQNMSKIADPDGMQVLYEGPKDCDCCTNWVETKPKDIGDTTNHTDHRGCAVSVRKKVSHDNDAPKSFEVHSFTVHSELAKPVLLEVFKDYPNLNLDPSEPTFRPPFAPFFDRWAQWEHAVGAAEDERLALHLNLIDDLVRQSLEPAFEAREKVSKDRVINFDLAWTVLQHGSLLYSFSDGKERLYKLKSWQYMTIPRTSSRALFAHAEDIEWTGFGFEHVTSQVLIAKDYTGHIDVRNFEVYPVDFHMNPDAVKAKLLARGKRYEELKGIHCKEYNAMATFFERDPSGYKQRNVEVDERVIIDAAQFQRRGGFKPFQYPEYVPQAQHEATGILHGNHLSRGMPKRPSHGYSCLPEPSPPPSLHRDVNIRSQRQHQFEQRRQQQMIMQQRQEEAMIRKRLDAMEVETPWENLQDTPSINDIPPLTDEELMICAPIFKGYSLTTHKWLMFEVDQIRDIEWNAQAFNQLALPEDTKELIQATIEMQIKQQSTFDDFIHGKGKGFIAMLSGSPGVGKTATVEAMSEMLKVPLFTISAADLGTQAAEVDKNLRDILKMTARWNAVLLLDEADIFLGQRQPNHLEHNAIVSTFLRIFEYHEGVLCLTTNRPRTLDRAILSRVHLNLVYPDLDAASRKAIWRRFAAANAKVAANDANDGGVQHDICITEEQFDVLSQSNLDGRQIKNVFKTAALLAAWKAQPLGFDILQRALRIVEMQVVG